jgi:hypothetical protein
MKRLRACLTVYALCLATSAQGAQAKAMRLPSSEEVERYVSSHWEKDYSWVFGSFLGISAAGSEVVSVRNVACRYYLTDGSVAECAFVVTARLKGGDITAHEMFSQFERTPDGALNRTLLIVDTRLPQPRK